MSRLHVVPDPEAEAAQWFARLRSDQAGRRDREQFEQWRASSDVNASAYDRLETLWIEIGDSAVEDPIMAMRREALAAAPARPARRWLPVAGVAATLAVAVLGLTLVSRDAAPLSGNVEVAGTGSEDVRVYRTGVGEDSKIRLADGSTVELNTDSLVRVDYGGEQRLVELVRGEALFDVAKDPARPFVVDAHGDKIVAHGTSFNVRQRGATVEVTLIEGKVTVERDGGWLRPRQRATLDPGQQLVASEGSNAFEIRSANGSEVASWREGRVVFDNEPLAKVVAEMNRYSERKIEIDDPTLESLRVTGVFRTGSPAAFTTALGASFPVDMRSDDRRNRVILRWRPGEAGQPPAM